MISLLKQTILVTLGSQPTLTFSFPQALEKRKGLAMHVVVLGLLLTYHVSFYSGSLSPDPNLVRGSIEPCPLHAWPVSKADGSGSPISKKILEVADRLKQVSPLGVLFISKELAPLT